MSKKITVSHNQLNVKISCEPTLNKIVALVNALLCTWYSRFEQTITCETLKLDGFRTVSIELRC